MLQAKMLNAMERYGYPKTTKTYYFMLLSMRQNLELERALDTLEEMKKEKLVPGLLSYLSVFDMALHLREPAIASRVLERSIHYQKVSPSIKYDNLMKFGIFPHFAAYGMAATIPSMVPTTTISTGIFILLGREPETLEQYILINKANLL